MTNIKFRNILLLILILGANTTIAQSIKSIVPDSAEAGSNLFVVITGTNTHWQNLPDSKVEIYFRVPDVVNPAVTIVNDTTLKVKFYLANNAKLGVRTLNLKYSKSGKTEYIIVDSSFSVYDLKKKSISD